MELNKSCKVSSLSIKEIIDTNNLKKLSRKETLIKSTMIIKEKINNIRKSITCFNSTNQINLDTIKQINNLKMQLEAKETQILELQIKLQVKDLMNDKNEKQDGVITCVGSILGKSFDTIEEKRNRSADKIIRQKTLKMDESINKSSEDLSKEQSIIEENPYYLIIQTLESQLKEERDKNQESKSLIFDLKLENEMLKNEVEIYIDKVQKAYDLEADICIDFTCDPSFKEYKELFEASEEEKILLEQKYNALSNEFEVIIDENKNLKRIIDNIQIYQMSQMNQLPLLSKSSKIYQEPKIIKSNSHVKDNPSIQKHRNTINLPFCKNTISSVSFEIEGKKYSEMNGINDVKEGNERIAIIRSQEKLATTGSINNLRGWKSKKQSFNLDNLLEEMEDDYIEEEKKVLFQQNLSVYQPLKSPTFQLEKIQTTKESDNSYSNRQTQQSELRVNFLY